MALGWNAGGPGKGHLDSPTAARQRGQPRVRFGQTQVILHAVHPIFLTGLDVALFAQVQQMAVQHRLTHAYAYISMRQPDTRQQAHRFSAIRPVALRMVALRKQFEDTISRCEKVIHRRLNAFAAVAFDN